MSEFSVDLDEEYRRGKPYRDTAAAFRGLSEELSGIVRTHPTQPSPVHGEDCFVEGLDGLVLLLQRIADKLDQAGLRASEHAPA
jgi:hypothetical protein